MYSGLTSCMICAVCCQSRPTHASCNFRFWATLFLCMRASSVLNMLSQGFLSLLQYHYTIVRRTFSPISIGRCGLLEILLRSLRSAPVYKRLRFGSWLQTTFPLNSALIICDLLDGFIANGSINDFAFNTSLTFYQTPPHLHLAIPKCTWTDTAMACH